MPFGIGRFIGRNAGTLGTIVGGAAGLAVGNPLLGASLGGALGGAVQTGSNNPSSNPGDFNVTRGTGLSELLSQQRSLFNEQRGRDLTGEASDLLDASGIGLDMGQFEASAAIRGAGRNAFGSLLREARERASTQRGMALGTFRSQLEREQRQSLEDLLGQRLGAVQAGIQGNQFALGLANQNQVEGNNRRDSFLNSTLSGLGTLAANRFASPGSTGGGNTAGQFSYGQLRDVSRPQFGFGF